VAIASRIGNIERFKRPDSLANYFGLTPGCHNSGEAIPCVIIGYTTSGNGLHGLVVAAEWEGILQYAGTLTVGLSTEVRARLGPLLARRIRPTPVIPCPHRGTWVEAELYCQVRCLERTPRGRLRGACFQGLLGEAE
jgi:ATP-dependent DNA ligase